MIAITVDDEKPMLNALTDIVTSSADIAEVHDFSTCTSALEWISQNHADVAFLDINMRGINGIGLAEKNGFTVIATFGKTAIDPQALRK